MKECREIRELLSTAQDGVLDAAGQSRVETHLAQCSQCREAQRELDAAIHHIRNLKSVEPPTWLTQKIMTKVHEDVVSDARSWKSRLRPLTHNPLLQAASLLIVCLTGYYLSRTPASRRPMIPTPEIKSEDARPPLPETSPPMESPTPIAPKARRTESEEPGFAPAPKAAGEGVLGPKRDLSEPTPAPSIQMPLADSASNAGAVAGAAPSPLRNSEKKTLDQARSKDTLKAERVIHQGSITLLSLRLEGVDPTTGRTSILKAVENLGGAVVSQEVDPSAMTIRMASRQWQTLLNRLEHIGTLASRPASPEGDPAEILVHIAW